MIENQAELAERISDNAEAYKRLMPEMAEPYRELNQEAYKDGAVSGRNKRLMALVGALVKGCRACILFQTDQALELGASVDEILEACGVALALGGTMGMGEITRVMAHLSEKGLLPE